MKHLWINIDGSNERKEFMEKQFKKLNIENIRIPAITPADFNNVLEQKAPYFCGNPECLQTSKKNCMYEYACLCSHIKAMQEALKYDDKYFIIIEDDIYMPYKIDYDKLISHLPENTDILQMMILYASSVMYLYNNLYCNNVKFIKYQPILPSTGMYLISRDGAQKLVDLYVNKLNKYDFSLYKNIKVADILLYTSVLTYATTIPYCYPYMKMGSEIHPDHLDVHDTAVNHIKLVLNSCTNNEYILENYLNKEDEL